LRRGRDREKVGFVSCSGRELGCYLVIITVRSGKAGGITNE